MHEGHRQRMYEKLANGDGLYDHELLEILLYGVIRRQNTNPIAHDLINAFGSLSGVFSASVEELKSVKGVGSEVAYFLKTVAECNKQVNGNFGGVTVLKHVSDFKEFVKLRMRGKLVEVVELYCLEKNGRVKRIVPFTSNAVNRVDIEIADISRAIAIAEPYGVVAAHNHLRGSCEPSDNDDRFTRDLQAVCNMNKVDLLDHCIYCATGEVYSYFLSGKIDGIKRNYTFDNLVSQQIKRETDGKKN